MAQMKSKTDIGLYIKQRIEKLGISQSDLAGKIAELRGDGYEKNSIKDNVSKWIRGERYPGTEYIYYLAQVLRVSVEEILVAGEVCDKYDDRPYTLYAVAKSGNRDAVEKIMTTTDDNGNTIGENYDEYDKTLLDYIIQFENIDLLHYLIEKQYVSFFENQIHTLIRIGISYTDVFQKIVSLAIKYDDLFVFRKAIKRTRPILLAQDDKLFENDLFVRNEYRMGYILSQNEIAATLNTTHILKYLTEPFVPSVDEWNELNSGIIYLKRNYHDEETAVKNFQTVSQSFNLLLNMALSRKMPVAEHLMAIAEKHNSTAREHLHTLYGKNEYRIGSEGNVTVGHHIGSLTVLAGVEKTLYRDNIMSALLRL